MSAKLKRFLENFDTIKDKVLQHEGQLDVDEPCLCNSPIERFKTVTCEDCFQAPPSCEECFLRAHEKTPFHWARKWNGKYYERVPQSALGRVIYLGHNGERCPTDVANQKKLKLSVVAMNGVHACEIIQCKCLCSGERWEQLLDVSLFPGTITAPETAIQFDVLKHFDTLCSASKVAAMDFVRTLRHMTNNAFPSSVPVRVSEIIHAQCNSNVLLYPRISRSFSDASCAFGDYYKCERELGSFMGSRHALRTLANISLRSSVRRVLI